jgi:hypothetical protein
MDPLLLMFCIALLPVGAVTGAIVGAGAAHSEESVEQATRSLKSALAEAQPVAGVERAIIEEMRGIGDSRYQVHAMSKSEKGLSNQELTKHGIDAVLEVKVSHLDLAVFGKLDPDASISLTVRASLHGTNNGTISAPLTWTYLGDRHDYFDLAADDGRLLRDLVGQSYEKIGKMIVTDLY